MRDTKIAYRWLIQQSKSISISLSASIVTGILIGITVIAQSALLAFMIDSVFLHHAAHTTLDKFLLLFLWVIFFRALLVYGREMISHHCAQQIKKNVRAQLFQHLMAFSPTQLSRMETGALSTTLIEQVEALHGFFADYLPQLSITVLLPLIILGFIFSQNWLVGVVLCVTAPLIPLFMALIGTHTAQLNQKNFQILARMGVHFLNILQGLTTLSLFYRAKSQLDSIAAISDDFRRQTMKILRIAFLSSAALELFATVSIAMIAVYLGLGLLGYLHIGFTYHITLGHALFILLLAPEFFVPLRQLGAFYHARAEAIGAATKIMEIVNTSIVKTPTTQNNVFHSEKIALCIRSLSFRYQHQWIVENLQLNVAPGTCAIIDGKSGAGKSTALNLIAKFITPSSGRILVNNIDIQTISDDHWRAQLGFLQQNTRLFYASIADNLRFAKPSARHAELMAATEKTGALEFILSLPNDFNTMIREHNAGLSGGQIQRLAIARLILKDAPLILLDEPTAHLDALHAKIIMELIASWHGKKTVVIATHDTLLHSLADTLITL